MPRVAAVQMSMSADMEENYQKALACVQEASRGGAQLVCFPEGQLSRYVAQYPGLKTDDFAVGLDHPYIQGLRAACRDARILGSFSVCLKQADGVYSANLLVSETGALLGVETKKHIVRAHRFYEQDYFSPGEGGFTVADTAIGRIGMIVCFDRHYPESFRTLALKGCELAIVPVANDKTEPGELFQWEMRVPAFQNSMYTLMCNRVGAEGKMHFSGQSLVAGPDGGVVALAGDGEQILYAELDFEKNRALRAEKQYLTLRRPEVFELG